MCAATITIPSPSSSPIRGLIFFIPGNPGLIDYYTPFLTLLSSLIHQSPNSLHSSPKTFSPSSKAYDIHGRDLLGFADADYAPFSRSNPPWDLESQIQHVAASVEEQGSRYDHVVLMGHSVGAYIAVETFSRWTQSPSSGTKLKNGVLLFPTLLHIAQSPSGRKLLWLSQTLIAGKVYLLAKAILFFIPLAVLKAILGMVLGFTAEASDITAGWLKSRDGVRQALHLGMDEMRRIGEDKWADELWEASSSPSSSFAETKTVAAADEKRTPRFCLFYAEEDHWVDSKGRDEFLRKLEGRVRVEIEDGGVKHAFCTKEWDTWVVAKKVAEWFGDMDDA